MAENYPNTTGFEAGHSDIELRVQGPVQTRYTGFKELKYGDSMDFSAAEGSQVDPVGWTRGALQPGEGEVKVLRRTYDQMNQDFGNGGFYSTIFSFLFVATPKGGQPYDDELIGVRFSKRDMDTQRGPDPSYVTVGFKFLRLKSDGIESIDTLQ